jgi:hypothetical protein
MNGFIALLFVIGCIIFAVVRYRSNSSTKRFGSKLVRRLDTEPQFAAEVAAELQNCYGSEPWEELEPLDADLSEIVEDDRIGKFQILRKIELPDGAILLVTLCRAQEYDAALGGGFKDATRLFQFSFLLKNNPEKKRLEIYSDCYDCLTSKLLRKEFVNQFFLKAA